mmetsp:Transcript_30961/g.57248  ORF Transcript_30961/g.57248 Transcript_30961/m.57248 type:complete len:131 (-) Transcript_30961:112-504(-)
MHHAASVAEHAITAYESIASDGLAEYLHTEGVGNDLLSFTVKVRVDESHVVVAGDAVAEGGQSLLHTADFDRVGQGVANVKQLLISGGVGEEQALLVPDSHTADETATGNGAVHHRNVIRKSGLEHRVET